MGCIRDETEDGNYIQDSTCDALTRLISGTIVARGQLQLPISTESIQAASLSVLVGGGPSGSRAANGGTGQPCACKACCNCGFRIELKNKSRIASVDLCEEERAGTHTDTLSDTGTITLPHTPFLYSWQMALEWVWRGLLSKTQELERTQ